MPEAFFLELDCVSGEKLIFRRAAEPEAWVEVVILSHGVKEVVQVQPRAFLLALQTAAEHLP